MKSNRLVFLTIPGLRKKDIQHMPHLSQLADAGSVSRVQHAFPAVTWPSQCAVLTGKPPSEHGIVSNGLFWREDNKVEMWTAWNEVIQQPQIWDLLKERNLKTAAWFPMLSKGCGADYVCMPAPIHQPDGSEDLWCYTKPQEFYGQLLEEMGHFPLQHFWGPMANIKSSQWIVDSAIRCAKEFQPDFFYIYLPHLDYAAQKFGPDSEQAMQAVVDLDSLLGHLLEQMNQCLENPAWMVHSEYVISAVDHVSYPNRILRESGLLKTCTQDDQPHEYLDFENSSAWAMVDHQFSHVFVKDHDPAIIKQVADLFADVEGIDQVLTGTSREGLDHPRSGDVILVSKPNSWQAYYWWLDDTVAPPFARSVDIHRKPGYDPVELSFDMATRSVPLDATIIKGSHGVIQDNDQGVIVAANCDLPAAVTEAEIFESVLKSFG